MTTLGPYELGEELGRGAMGRVFRARHAALGVERAVKVMEGLPSVESLDRFRRESEALARVAGRGVVPVHEAGVEQGRLYFAMDLLEGGSLAALLKREGRLDWRRAATLVAKLARVLERCGAAGLVHRDVKPGNVLLDATGEPYLADFGCVRDLEAASLTESGAALGTQAYMAPEQLAAERPTPAADVFALGVVLHELVTGTRPYPGPSLLKLLEQARRGERAKASEVAGSPRELDLAIARALDPVAGGRIAAGAFASELEKLVTSAPGARSARRVGVAVAAVVLGGACLLVVIARGPAGEKAPPAAAPSVATVATTSPPAPRLDPRARRALDELRDLAHLDTIDRAFEALGDLRPDALAAFPDDTARIGQALRAEIVRVAKEARRTRAIERYLAAGRGFTLLRRIQPAASPPAELREAARLIVSDSLTAPELRRRDEWREIVDAHLWAVEDTKNPADRAAIGDLAASVIGPSVVRSGSLAFLDDASQRLVDLVGTPQAHLARGRVLIAIAQGAHGKADAARAELEAALREGNRADQYEAAQLLAAIEYGYGRYDLALRELARGWESRDPTTERCYCMKAALLIGRNAKGDVADARELLRQAIEQIRDESRSGWLRDRLAELDAAIRREDAGAMQDIRSALFHGPP